jgi:hypothetical protein
MNKKDPNDFFNDVNFKSTVETIKNIYTSDASMATLMDFERVLDSADIYAFRNWDLGELVDGPRVKKYIISCMFQWPYKLMPDPRGAKRLLMLGGKLKFKKTKIKVPIEIKNESDFVPGTKYPKTVFKAVWLVYIQLPRDLIEDVREGSVDLAGQSIDLQDIDDAYQQDLDKVTSDDQDQEQSQAPDQGGMGMPMAPPQM